jgi:ADP-ribose pyrophosphatase YjhB (NUDIX family)
MGRAYPSQPVVGLGAIVLQRDDVLLVRRGNEPQKGLWSVPGGALELGESLQQGVRREVLEETGLEVRVLEFAEVLERIMTDDRGAVEYHYVLLDYLCEPVGGALSAGDDAVEAAWVNRADLSARSLTPGLEAVIEKAFQLRDRNRS